MYDTKLAELKERVQRSGAIALSSDFWTSLGNEAYCGITGHWINGDWEMQYAIYCIYKEETIGKIATI